MSDKKEQKAITARAKDYSEWYQDVVDQAELAEHSPVRGCMVIKPYGYAIWELMQKDLDARFKAKGVQNAYFPLFIPENFLKREAQHVEGFAPEVAVVTHAGGQKLDEPLVVRPTSETIMYDVFSRWVQSYRDLPLLINQWANIVRWEMRTRLFLRTTEFLWQEGHTVHASEEEAEDFTKQILDVYRDFAESVMATPVIPGVKSESEKFAGAVRTYCIEAMMGDGKALQAGTSHMLGQNFAKAFGVKFQDETGTEQYGWQTSWGVSTRLIGGLIMAHGDDKGLVLPPKLAPYQVVIIPIGTTPEELEAVQSKAQGLADGLIAEGVRVKIDTRDLRPGPKFFEWEKKGVPVRLEIGPKDMANGTVVAVRRDTAEKQNLSEADLIDAIKDMLEQIHVNLYDKALAFRQAHTVKVADYDSFKAQLEGNFILAGWCGSADCEATVKAETKATIRCLPLDPLDQSSGGKCIYCGQEATDQVVFAKAY
ncbi:MAG TPA: proline--tRNA ligase [bacterium]|nr:MAG: Proline--tRNA ligase [Parcubacteria group bacterium ADurb.Bin192]HPN15004.1 proline--tRNA ligase [bacterium]